jgi:RimJ/RimL family protein N-acetyltransferase
MRLAWKEQGRPFEAVEPDAPMVEEHADTLLRWYNARENASMMNGSGAMSRADVLEFWRELRSSGAHGFLSFVGGALVGDMDIRAIRGRSGEFAIMIGDDANKGRGIGKALARMIHVFAFRELGIERLFVSPRRDNVRVLALEAFLGYQRDDGPEARERADEDPSCATYSLAGDEFRRRHEDAWREVEVKE